MYTCMVNNHCLIIQVKIYGVPFVPLHLYVKNKLSIFWASISKSNFDFGMELRFQNGASISKWGFNFEIELRFQNGASISKWSFDFEMEFRFRNGTSISKSSIHFKMVLRFWNGKWNCGFKIEDFVKMLARNQVKKCKSVHWRELNRKDREMKDSLWHVGKGCLLSICNMCC